jgi:glycosyltransferase involved in cell wall biosynthesis
MQHATIPADRPAWAQAATDRTTALSSVQVDRSQRVDRILMIAPQPFYQDRGTPIALRHVLQALGELDYEVDLLSFPLGRPLAITGVSHQTVANPLGFRSMPIGFSFKKLFLDLVLLAAACRQLRRRRYRLVHAVEEAAYFVWLPCRVAGVPLVYDMQSSIPEQVAAVPVLRSRPVQWLLRRAEGWLVRHADYVVASAGLGRHVAAIAPAVPHREWRFPERSGGGRSLPPDRSGEQRRLARKELDLPRQARLLVYSGNFEPYQGLDVLLQALPLVAAAAPDSVLVLVGAEGEAQSEAVRSQLDPALQAHLRVVARQPRERVGRYLAAADILVSPRLWGDNAPLKIFDYLGAARPIVATDILAHRAVLQADIAILVDATPEALADAMVRILADDALAARMAEAASAFGRERLGWPAFLREVNEIYAPIGGSRR